MKRICFVLQVKPDRLAEYKERHRNVWPDMQAALRETGWGNYTLFLRDDGLLDKLRHKCRQVFRGLVAIR